MIEFVEIIDGKVMVGGAKPLRNRFGKSIKKGSAGKQYYNALAKHEAELEPVVNADKLVRCSKCNTLGIVLEGELPIMCQLPMAVRTSGICGGSYSIYHEEEWNGQKVETKLTPEGKAITKIL